MWEMKADTICKTKRMRIIDLLRDICKTIRMSNEYVHGRTCVYNVNYHIIWCTKYRRKVLTAEITERLYSILHETGEQKGFTVVDAKVGEMDHIHCFVSAPPKYSITDIVRWLKGISGRYLLMEYPGIQEKLWRGHLWNGSYYVETIGSTSEENIRKYIERQRNVQI